MWRSLLCPLSCPGLVLQGLGSVLGSELPHLWGDNTAQLQHPSACQFVFLLCCLGQEVTLFVLVQSLAGLLRTPICSNCAGTIRDVYVCVSTVNCPDTSCLVPKGHYNAECGDFLREMTS